MKCRECEGTGYVCTSPAIVNGPEPEPAEYDECVKCEGRGVVDGPLDETIDAVIKLNLTDIRNEAISQAVSRVLRGDNYTTFRDRIEREAIKEVRPAIEAAVSEVVRETLSETIHQTDRWGSRKSESTTLREIIMEEARKFINRKPEKDYRGHVTRKGLDGMVYGMVKDLFATELRKDLEAAKQGLKGKINKRLGEELAVVISGMLK